ncbi:MAG TPA: N-acetylmuramoyl-L-alanine amidase [Alphaproteobacteria bacterium]
MKNFTAKCGFLFALCILALSGFAGRAAALTVQEVRFGEHPDKVRIVLELSEATDFRVFLLPDPWRIVIDMPDFGWQVKAVPTPVTSGIRSIRQGALQAGVSRIVIDMNKPVVIKSVFTLPRDRTAPERLVIDFAGASEAAFRAQKGKVFGRLNVEGQPPLSSAPLVAAEPSPQQMARNNVPVPPSIPLRDAEIDNDSSDSGVTLPPRKPARDGKPLIVIDAGHGGIDPGAIGSGGIAEKNVTLTMAKELKRQLEASGRYRVMLTRDKDTYLRLHQRIVYAREKEGDLFISLHADSIGKGNVRGASVYTLSENASDEQTEMLAQRENRADLIAGVDLSAEDEVVVNILVDLTMRDTMNQSSFLANTVVDSLNGNGIRTLENPHRSAGFAVLKAPDVPSILIEMGFMSNGADAQMLSGAAFQQKFAKSIVRSLDQYFEKVHQSDRS